MPATAAPPVPPPAVTPAAAADVDREPAPEEIEDGEVEEAEMRASLLAEAKRTGRSAGQVDVAWNVAPFPPGADGPDPRVDVTLVVSRTGEGSDFVHIGPLYADDDTSPSGPQNCKPPKTTKARSVFTCGGTPRYDAYEARLRGRELVVTHVVEVDGDPSASVRAVVRRIPVPPKAWLHPSR